MGSMSVLDNTGDSKVEWDANNQDSIKKAMEQFNKLKGKNHTFFVVDQGGHQGRQIESFDPNIESIIAVPTTKKG